MITIHLAVSIADHGRISYPEAEDKNEKLATMSTTTMVDHDSGGGCDDSLHTLQLPVSCVW